MAFNEDSRVKLPGLLHFLRLGYKYQTKKKQNIQQHNNIFVDVFKQSMKDINGRDYSDEQIDSAIQEIETLTDNRIDKGKSFYERMQAYSDMMLVDLEHPERNDFRVVSELTYKQKKEDELSFRPDITILINGIPMGFIEVKKPNNKDGIQAEFKRMRNERLNKEEFVPYFNQLQVLGFTNNQKYDDGAVTRRMGSYYTTPNKEKTSYNHFREEQEIPVNDYISEEDIIDVLSDNNAVSIRNEQEFLSNLRPDTYANKFITSVFSKERLIFFIRYGIAYVNSPVNGFDKHIIRYPQMFALNALKKDLKEGMKRGVLWHTQGSGKTAFTYYATKVLRDYFQEQKVITKFYFVVDRLDLLNQAIIEFSARGMTIANIASKEDFEKNMQSPVVTDNSSQAGKYQETMNVVNIQKFTINSIALKNTRVKVQRIYFMDEVHRGYKPKGTFLGNLLASDPDGIFIGLTGTPILSSHDDDEDRKVSKRDFKTTDLFTKYIHKYYYNKSIADGYTLKIKKENIDIRFRNNIRAMLGVEDNAEIPAKKWEEVTEAQEYVDQLCPYIVDDFNTFETVQNDKSMGFMIVAVSTEQAKRIQEWFENNTDIPTALVLCDEDCNKEKQDYFRGKRDPATGETIIKYKGVIVLHMLLTGFDAPRLKRLYLMRTVREHNLLQTLARVNRPYKSMRYGYVVDFVDITQEYEETNRRYLEELRADIGDEDTDIDDMFVDVEEVKKKIQELENQLFIYMGNIENNLEAFREQIEPLDEKTVRAIDAALVEYRECYNELRMSHEDVSNIPIDRINKAHYEASRRVDILVAERLLNNDDDSDDSGIDFSELIVEFLRRGEVNLEFTTEDDILELLNSYNNVVSSNQDEKDPAFIDVGRRYKAAIRDFKLNADSTKKVKDFMDEIKALITELQVINANNNGLINRYSGSEEYMRIHKRIVENYSENMDDVKTYNFMKEVIKAIDELIGHMKQPSKNVVVRELLRPAKNALKAQGFTDVSKRQVENIVNLFVADKFKED